MDRIAATEFLRVVELERTAVPGVFDAMYILSERLRTDASGTALLNFHGQHLHVFAEGSPAGLAQPGLMHFHADGWKSLKGLQDGDADSEELRLSC